MIKLGPNEIDDLIDVILSDDKLVNYVMKLIHQQHISPEDLLIESKSNGKTNQQQRKQRNSLQVVDEVILKAFEDVRIGDMVKNILREQEQELLASHTHHLRTASSSEHAQSPGRVQTQLQTSRVGQQPSNTNRANNSNGDSRYLEIQKEVEQQKLLRQQKELQQLLQQQQQQAQQQRQPSSSQQPSTNGVFYPQKHVVDTSVLESENVNNASSRNNNKSNGDSAKSKSISDNNDNKNAISKEFMLDIPQWDDEQSSHSIENDSGASQSHNDESSRYDQHDVDMGEEGSDHDGDDSEDEMKPNYSFSEPEQVTYHDSRRKVKQLNKQRAIPSELANTNSSSNQQQQQQQQQQQCLADNSKDNPQLSKRPAPLQQTLSIEVDQDNEEFSMGESERNNNSFLSEPVTMSEASTVRMVVTPVSTSMPAGELIATTTDSDSITSNEEEARSKPDDLHMKSASKDDGDSNKLTFQQQRARSGRNSPGKPNTADGSTNKHRFDFSDDENDSEDVHHYDAEQDMENNVHQHDVAQNNQRPMFESEQETKGIAFSPNQNSTSLEWLGDDDEHVEVWERKVMQRMKEEEDEEDENMEHHKPPLGNRDEVQNNDGDDDEEEEGYPRGLSRSKGGNLKIDRVDMEPLRMSDQDFVRVDDSSPLVSMDNDKVNLASTSGFSPNNRYNEMQDASHMYEDDYEAEDDNYSDGERNKSQTISNSGKHQDGAEEDEVTIFQPVIASNDPNAKQIDHDEFKYMRDLDDPNSPNPRPNQPLYFDQSQFDSEVDRIIAGKPLKHVKFSNEIVSNTYYREKTSPSEKTNLYYTHIEEGNFCAAQSREYAKADAMGLTWMEYMNQRDDHDASLEDEVVEDDYQDDYEMEGDEEFEHDYHHYYHDNDDEVFRRQGIEFSDDMDDSEEAF